MSSELATSNRAGGALKAAAGYRGKKRGEGNHLTAAISDMRAADRTCQGGVDHGTGHYSFPIAY